jgi:hypothetical protein
MNFKKLLLILFFTSGLGFSAFAQRDSVSLETIMAKTAKLYNDRPVEKIYLHFDKPYYAAGDTIWFKVYLTVDLHMLSSLSKVAYVELFNNRDSLISEMKLKLINGTAYGNITLPKYSTQQGNYRVRAYTNWMRNWDPAYFFNKNITIGNAVDDQIHTRITFNNQISESTSKIDANIYYTDKDGSPLANKKVNWKIQGDDETLTKGKGVTDANGLLNITYSSNKITALSSGSIQTVVELENKRESGNSFALKLNQDRTDVQFFPEGGYLLNGLRSKVAVKVVKPNGLGMDFKGTITDNSGTEIASFSSQHLGMGIFPIVPDNTKTYKAKLIFADGTQGSYDLPRIKSEGISVGLNNTGADNIEIKIASNDAFFQKNQNKTYYVTAQSGGVILYAAKTPLKNQVYTANIPKDKFPTGIVQFTLFSSYGEPLSERIAFVQHNDQLNLKLVTDKQLYNRRGKVKMVFTAQNKQQPVEGTFSVSVIDESKVAADENLETTILTNILLTSDLKGYIEKPNYYFNHPNETTAADLDVLMLTQGYRRISYKNIIADKNPPLIILPEQGIEISGILRNQTGLPIAKGNIRLLIPDKSFSAQTQTDMSGNFQFTNLIIPDSAKVVVNARNNTNSNTLMLSVNGSIQPPPITRNYNKADEITNIDSVLRPYLDNSKRQYNNTQQLREVVIKSTAVVKKVSHEDYSSLRGLSMQPDHLIPGDRFKGCLDLLTCMPSTALGITYDNNAFYITRDYNNGKRTPMAIYVGGMPVDYSYLTSVNPMDLESVEIFNNDGLSSINRNTGTNGILVINTKVKPKGHKPTAEELRDLLPQNNVVTFNPQGYFIAREFYSPKYDPAVASSVGIDLRTTVYWNPKIITDKTGTVSFEYFNSDGRGTYRAVIEGIDKDGNLGRFTYRYKVQ